MFFRKPKPLKLVPAGTELFNLADKGVMGCCGGSEGVIDAVKGWAADVEVAAGGPSWLLDAGPQDAGVGSIRRGREVERSRRHGSRNERKRSAQL